MAIAPAAAADEGAPNHPSAVWMAVIASISFNLVIGCIIGSVSVLTRSVEERMHVSEAMAGLGGPLIIVGSALIAVVVGELAARFSLRLLMFIGAAMSVAGFLLLALTNSYPIYVAVCALLFGPSMSLSGSVGPATLVTRWFSRNRGLALGLVNLSIGNTVVPIVSHWLLEQYGARATYLAMAVAIGVILLPMTLLIRDWPPGANKQLGEREKPAAGAGGMTLGQLGKQAEFWVFAMAAAITISATMVLTFSMVQLGQSWGLSSGQGAILLTIMSFAGMAGSVLFGWVADRIGGARGLALLCVDYAIVFVVLLFKLPFALLAVVIAVAGLHGSGTIPNVSRALAASFGTESYSRAFGFSTALSVPVTVIAVVGMASIHTGTGSYVAGFIALAAVLIALALLTFAAHKRSAPSISLEQR
jgi:MFS family permease